MGGWGDKEMGSYQLPITHYPLPMTHYPLPIAPCPIPYSLFPIPYSLLSIFVKSTGTLTPSQKKTAN